MAITLRKKMNIPEEIIDWTDGRKPGKGEELVTLQISMDGEESKETYRIIGKKLIPIKPLTAAEKRAIRKSEEGMGRIGYYLFFSAERTTGFYSS